MAGVGLVEIGGDWRGVWRNSLFKSEASRTLDRLDTADPPDPKELGGIPLPVDAGCGVGGGRQFPADNPRVGSKLEFESRAALSWRDSRPTASPRLAAGYRSR